jgi:O-antigen/teichoic acid export membrane protein
LEVCPTAKSNLARGAAIMVVCVALAKFLGLIYNIPLSYLIGPEGLGIYSVAYSLYNILLVVSTSGFPTALGRLISERLALKRYADVEQMFTTTLRVVCLFGCAAFLLMWFGAPWYCRLVALKAQDVGVDQVVWSVRALAPSLLVVPLLSALRGYVQGFQNMTPSAYSQAVEQLVRVITIVVGAYLVVRWWHPGDIAGGAAAATFGAFTGALAGLFLLLAAIVPLRRRFHSQRGDWRVRESRRQSFRILYQYALPVSLGALVVPISSQVDSLTVQNFLMWAGDSFHEAAGQFGILTRQAIPLINIPLAFAYAIGASVMPAIAHAKTLRDARAVEASIRGTIRSMFFITFPTAAVLLVLARPVDMALYGTHDGWVIIASVSFMSVFSGLELISTYMLQGIGEMYRPVRNMFIGVAIKTLCNLALILPFGIIGAAIASTIGYLFSSTLNILAVKKYGDIQFSVWRLISPALMAALILCVVLVPSSWLGARVGAGLFTAHPVAQAWLQLMVALVIGAIVYIVAGIRLSAVTSDELAALPAIGPRLARLAAHLQPTASNPSGRRPH